MSPVMTRRTRVAGVDELVRDLREASRQANEAIKQVGWRVVDDFAQEVAARGQALGSIEGRNLRDNRVFAAGAVNSVHLEARFGGTERFSGGATTSLLVRPYEFATPRGSIVVVRRAKAARPVTYRRRFPMNTNPDGRVVFPLAKKHARRLVEEIVTEVYAAYRIALGDPGWVQVSRRG